MIAQFNTEKHSNNALKLNEWLESSGSSITITIYEFTYLGMDDSDIRYFARYHTTKATEQGKYAFWSNSGDPPCMALGWHDHGVSGGGYE